MPPVDEGMIHAWLDGALSADEAARIEQLVASDPAWGAAAAEARGLIAASSRILSSLDAVPANVAPAAIPTVSAAREQMRTAKVEPVTRRAWRPQAWALAATLVMAVGAGVLWQNTPNADRTVMADAKAARPVPESSATVVAEHSAPAALEAAPAARQAAPAAAQAAPAQPTELASSATARARTNRADQIAAARVPATEPTVAARSASGMAERGSAERAKEAKKSEEGPKDVLADARANLGRAAAGGAGGAAPVVAAVPAAQPVTPPTAPVAGGSIGDVKERAAANAPAQNALKATASARDEAVGASGVARRALAAPAPVTGCWTVRLTQYTPTPSFPVPVGVLLDSAHSGGGLVARALVGSNAPTPPPGQWTTSDDSLRVTIDRAVLGYTLRAAVSLQTRTGRATLGDADTPVRTSALAELQPSRCPAP